jgi:hypothetical protein
MKNINLLAVLVIMASQNVKADSGDFDSLSKEMNSGTKPTFISACRTLDDPYFKDGTRLFFLVTAEYGELFSFRDDYFKSKANYTFGRKPFMETQGGLGASVIDEDVINYLLVGSFSTRQNITKTQLMKMADNSVCKINYRTADAYYHRKKDSKIYLEK